MSVATLSLTLVAWYTSSIANNVVAKSVLKSFPFPKTLVIVTLILQFCAAAVSRTRMEGKPKLEFKQCFKGAAFVGSLLCHKLALKNASVPFTLAVKASCSTLCAALFSRSLLAEKLPLESYYCLAVVVCGVVLATLTELEFSAAGFMAAGASGACQALVSVLQKLAQRNGAEKAEVYYETVLVALLIFLPVWILTEARSALPALESRDRLGLFLVFLSGVALLGQEVFSFLFLSRVKPVSHAIANSARTVVVIRFSVIWFATKTSTLNSLGIFISIIGMLLYSWHSQARPGKIESKV